MIVSKSKCFIPVYSFVLDLPYLDRARFRFLRTLTKQGLHLLPWLFPASFPRIIVGHSQYTTNLWFKKCIISFRSYSIAFTSGIVWLKFC